MAEATRAGVFVCAAVSVFAIVHQWRLRRRVPPPPALAGSSATERQRGQGRRAKADNRKPEPTLELKIIGHIRSCFPMKRAIPRQGHFVPSSHAELTLRKGIAPSCLEGIEEYSHVWIIYHMHGSTASDNGSLLKSKIQPPKLGSKVGLFSTRSPHRPNPVGLSVVRLNKVDLKKGVLHLSGIDFLSGTPVLDIKPYIPHYESISQATTPQWVADAFEQPLLDVSFSADAQADLARLLHHMHFYAQPADAAQAVTEVLAVDIRSGAASTRAAQGKIAGKGLQAFCFPFDGLDFVCQPQESGEICVLSVHRLGTSPIK